MNFLADEGIDFSLVQALRKIGHDVLYIAELAPGIDDDDVLERAKKEERVLLTLDKDFGELVFRMGKVHKGVILIRLEGLKTETKTKIALTALEKISDADLDSFIIIQPGAIRVKKRKSPE